MNKRLSLYLSIVVIVVSLGLTGIFRLQQNRIDQQTSHISKTVSNRKKS